MLSLVVRVESIKILIAIAARVNWKIHHLNVKTSFLNGGTNEDISISQLEGFLIIRKEDHALKLQKALYGLEQAPRSWNSKLNEALIHMGFVRSKNDYEVYYETKMDAS